MRSIICIFLTLSALASCKPARSESNLDTIVTVDSVRGAIVARWVLYIPEKQALGTMQCKFQKTWEIDDSALRICLQSAKQARNGNRDSFEGIAKSLAWTKLRRYITTSSKISESQRSLFVQGEKQIQTLLRGDVLPLMIRNDRNAEMNWQIFDENMKRNTQLGEGTRDFSELMVAISDFIMKEGIED